MRGLFLFFISLETLASSFMPQPFPSWVANSPILIRGIVGNSKAEWGTDEDNIKRIYTYYEIQKVENLKNFNESATTITIRELGGTLAATSMIIPGAATFTTGESVVLALRIKNSENSYDLQGLSFGKLTLTPGNNGEENLNGPALNGSPNSIQQWTLSGLQSLLQEQHIPPSASSSVTQTVTLASQPNRAPPISSSPSPLQENPSKSGWLRLEICIGLGLALALLLRLLLRRNA